MSISSSNPQSKGRSTPRNATSPSPVRSSEDNTNSGPQFRQGSGNDSVGFSQEVNEPSRPEPESRVNSLISAMKTSEAETGSAALPEAREPSFDEAVTNSHQSLQETAESRKVEVDPEAEVAIIDSFGTETTPGHGDAVEYVFQEATPESQPEVQRFEVSPADHPPEHFFTAPGDATPEERLESFVEHMALDGLMQTNSALESILDDPDSAIRTINQSQGMSPAKLATMLHRQLYERDDDGNVALTDAGRTILDALGMEDTGPSAEQNIEFAELATQRVEEIFQNSEVLGQELDRHSEFSEELAERGVSYVVSAGNEANFGSLMGAELEGGFDDNLLTNPHNITVGAVDQTTGDVADFSSDDPEVDFMAPGVDIKIGEEDGRVANGTSFSTPMIADRLDALREENPDVSQEELLELLEESFGGRTMPWTA